MNRRIRHSFFGETCAAPPQKMRRAPRHVGLDFMELDELLEFFRQLFTEHSSRKWAAH